MKPKASYSFRTGAAADYSLLYVARYREELRDSADKGAVSMADIRKSTEPIRASGGAVIAALLGLLPRDLKSNGSKGPVAAIGILFATPPASGPNPPGSSNAARG